MEFDREDFQSRNGQLGTDILGLFDTLRAEMPALARENVERELQKHINSAVVHAAMLDEDFKAKIADHIHEVIEVGSENHQVQDDHHH